jgi:predicted PurR-regulated permease PerM
MPERRDNLTSTPHPAPYDRPLTWALWTLLGVAGATLIYALKAALLPFFLAFVVAYVFAPWVNVLEQRWRVARPLGTALVFLVISGLLVGLVIGLLPVFHSQFMELVGKFPEALSRIRDAGIPLISTAMGRLAELGLDNVVRDLVAGFMEDPAAKVQQAAPAVATGAKQVGIALVQSTTGVLGWIASGAVQAVFWVIGAAIVPVLVFYLMMDFPQVANWLRQRLPDGETSGSDSLLNRIDRMLGEFLRGQLIVGVILSVLYAVGLTLAGVDGAITIGIIAGIGNMVPYLGFVIGITLSLLISLLAHFDILHLVYVLIVFGVVQLLEGFVISPKIVGDRVGLHPLAIIFALFVGAEAFGFLGVLLGVPMAVVVKALLERPVPASG